MKRSVTFPHHAHSPWMKIVVVLRTGIVDRVVPKDRLSLWCRLQVCRCLSAGKATAKEDYATQEGYQKSGVEGMARVGECPLLWWSTEQLLLLRGYSEPAKIWQAA
jgi:hypothetical protein